MRAAALVGALLVATLALAAAAVPAAAQFPDEVRAGVRVRVAIPDAARQDPLLPDQQWLRGTVREVARDTLHLDIANTGGMLAIPRASVRSLAVSRGVPSRLTSALRHGTSLGLLLAAFSAIGPIDDDVFDSRGQAALVTGAGGFVLGAVLGAVRPSERWRTLRLRD